jgi:rhodanese-related sulfurtransferase
VKQLAPKGKIGKISADELKIMIEDGTRFFLVDNRSEYEYRLGHLPGAVSIMRYRFKDLAALLPGDKQFPIVFYCNGMGCQPSKAAAEAAKTLGYDNIAVFSGGYPEWMKKGYAIEKGK